MNLIKALFILTTVVFWRVGIADYVQWDDPVFMSDNALLRESFWPFLQQIFSHYFFGDFIPVTLLSYWAEYQLWGLATGPQHIFNLLLHLANIFLIFTYLRKISISHESALFVAALFAIHPMQSEVVMWISERKSLLAIFFTLLAMHSAQKFSEKKDKGQSNFLWWLGYVFLFSASLLSKSTALLLPILLATSDRSFFKLSWSEILKKHSFPFALALAWGWLRTLAYTESVQNSAAITLNPERILGLPAQVVTALGFYIEKFFIPLQLSIIYPSFPDFQNQLWSLFSVLFFIGCAIWGYRKKNPQVLYFLILVILFLIPVLQIVPRINFVSDRYLYFPMIGLSGLLTCIAPSFLKNKLTSFLIIGCFAFICFKRTDVWVSDLNLWTDTVQKNPKSGLAQNNLGLAHLKNGNIEAAIIHFETSSKTGLKEGTAHLAFHNLGMIYFSPDWPKLKDAKKAENFYLQSIQTSSIDSAASKLNLALLYAETGQPQLALQILIDLETDLSSRRDQKNQNLLILTRKFLEILKK